MRYLDHTPKWIRSRFARMSGVAGLLLSVGLLLAAPASAAYEQVTTFPGAGGTNGLQDARGLAVNVSGAGGVPAGTLYAVTRTDPYVVRYNHKGEFLGQWSAGGSVGVAVNQATGYVYLLTQSEVGKDSVFVYTADGSQLIDSFGERGAFEEAIDDGPEKTHTVQASGIAVDSSGVVYVSDLADSGVFESRVMVFEPGSPGDYEHYVYAGRANDIAYFKNTPSSFEYPPGALSLDAAGNLYVAREGGSIQRFAPGEPATPDCKVDSLPFGVTGMTVNPETGEVFAYAYKTRSTIHHFRACNSQGELVERGTFDLAPKLKEPEYIGPLAFNPELAWSPSRSVGLLYAANPFFGPTGLGYIFAPAEVFPPSVESQSVSSVTSTSASLSAQINPKGSDTSYVFQYLTDAEYEANEPSERFAGATEAPLGGGTLGGGQLPLPAGVSLTGLAPDTGYRYRVIATSNCDPEEEEEVCEDVGPPQAFRTYPVEAPALPNNRAWELVSPAQKNGGQVIPADPSTASCGLECKPSGDGFPLQSAPDGETVVYQGQPFSLTEGAAKFNEYHSRRTPSGWQTTILSPALMIDRVFGGSSTGYKAFNAELTQGVLSQGIPTLTPAAPPEYNNLYIQPTADPSALTPLMGFEAPNRNPVFIYAGASADFSRHFFEANDALTGETPFAPEALDPGPPVGSSQPMNLYEWEGGELRLVNVLSGNAETVTGAVFGSGKQHKTGNPNIVVSNFSHAISADGSRLFWSDEAGQVYVRENAESTVAIPDSGKFLTASADGSRLLLTNGHLYDIGAEEPAPQQIADLSQGQAGFQGIAGQSEDLSHIYFVDTAVLTGEEENDHGAKAQAGGFNLYTWNGGTIAFLATLVAGDNATGGALAETTGDWLASPTVRTAQASPDGRWLAFLSKAPLTGYDNTGPCFNGSCREVFLYDSASGKLICPSCNPTGARPLGRSQLRVKESADGSLPQPRYLLDSGRLYFDTQDSLTPFDTNGGVEDVYQYEPQGVGGCKREDGCVSLISAGREPVDSNLAAVDATAKNVFFTTRDRLVKKDPDDLIDLYVAREGGGIAEESESECQGEACQPAAIAPNDPTPSSASFQGPGNLKQRPNGRCSKGKVRRRGRCVRKRHHKRSHGRAAKRNRGGAR